MLQLEGEVHRSGRKTQRLSDLHEALAGAVLSTKTLVENFDQLNDVNERGERWRTATVAATANRGEAHDVRHEKRGIGPLSHEQQPE